MTSLRKYSIVLLVVAALAGLIAAPAQAQVTVSCTLPSSMTTSDASHSTSCVASGGTSPYTFNATGVPTGMFTQPLAAEYLIYGTPSVSGTYNFSITATDSVGRFGTQSYTVTVTGGGTSSGLQLTSISPTSGAPSTQQILTLNGTGFTSTCVVYFNGISFAPTVIGSTQLQVTIPANYVTGSTIPVYVHDIANNASSTTINFIVSTTGGGSISLYSLSPATIPVGSQGFTLSINGTGFTGSQLVTFGPYTLTGNFVNSNLLSVNIPSNYLTTAQTYNVSVAGSNVLQFVVGTGNGGTGGLTITCNSQTTLIANVQFLQSCTVGGGDGNYTWSFSGLPSGLNPSATAGSSITISGTPTFAQSYTITVTDAAGKTGSYTYSAGSTGGTGTYSITSISPTSTAVGSSPTITVIGGGFTVQSQIYFNGNLLATQYVNSNQLIAIVPSTYTQVAGSYNVFVITSGLGTTNNITFTVGTGSSSGGPTLTSVSPSSVPAGSGDTTLLLSGSGFGFGATVNFGSFTFTSNYQSSFSVTVLIPRQYLTTAQTVNVSVGTSNSVPFTIGSGSTGTLSLSCSPTTGPSVVNVFYTQTCTVIGGTAPFTWTVNGLPTGVSQAFSNSSTVTISGYPTTSQAYSYNVNVTDALQHTGSLPITGTVSTSSYNVTSLSPSSATVGSGNVSISVLGTGFTPSSIVQFNSTQLATQYVSTSQLSATIPSSYLAGAQTANISVTTPGLGTTNNLTFTVGSGSSTGGTLTLSCSPGIGPSTVGTNYITTCTASGGNGNYTWPTPSGLPNYLTYNTTTGSTVIISGTPAVSSPYNFTVKVTDSSSPSQTGSLQLAGQTTTSTSTGGTSVLLSSLSPTSTPVGTSPITLTISGSGFSSNSQVIFDGFAVVTTFINGSLVTANIPGGYLTFARSVLVTVTTPGSGTSNGLTFAIGNGGSVQMTINCAPGVGPSTPNSYYTGNCSVNGGTAPYTWSVVGGSLPSGLSLNPNGPLASISGYTSLNGPYSYTVQVLDSSSPNNNASLVFAGETGAGSGGTGGLSITSLSPSSIAIGSGATTLNVYGVGFVSGAQIYFNGSPLATTVVSSSQLTATIPATSLAQAQSFLVYVLSNGQTSNSLSFVVGTATSSSPISISCNPTTGPAIPGAYFTTCNVAGGKAPYTWTATGLPPGLGFTSNNTTAQISGSLPFSTNYSTNLQVTDSSTPPLSTTYSFIGTMPTSFVSTITSMSPISTPAGSSQVILNITGTGFASGVTQVLFGNTFVTATVLSSTQLTATIPANLLAVAGNVVVQLSGTVSNSVDFFVTSTGVSGVSPSSLSFTYGIGGTLPATQNLTLTSIGGANGYSVSINGLANNILWLATSQASGAIPGTLGVTVAPIGLPVGNYSGSITLNAFNAAGTVTIPVTLTVTGQPTLTPSTTNLTLTGPTGGSVSQTIKVTSSDGNTVFAYNIVPTSNNGGNWLSVSPNSGSTPGTFTVTASASNLAPSTYSGTISLTATGNVPSQIAIPVTFIVTSPATLTVSPTTLSFTGQSGQSNPAAQNISVSASNNAIVNYTVAATTASGGNWLSATASGTTPGTIAVSTNISNLAGGTYNGTVTITAPGTTNSPMTVAVTLTVTNAPGLTPSPASLSFSYTTGGTAPAAQTLSIAGVNGTGTFNFTVASSTASGGNWLSTTPTTGTTPGSVSVAVNPTNLTAGSYSGTLTLTASGAGPVTVPVTLTVITLPTLSASPTSVTFTAQAGGSNPDAQNIAVSASGSANLAYTVGVSVTGSGTWLGATASGNTPGSISVTINTSGLSAGTYQGTVTITSSGASNSPLTVPVTLTLNPPPATLTVTPQTLTFSATVNGSAPPPQSVAVSTSNNVNAGYTVAAQSTGNWLAATASGTTPGTISVTVNQSGLAIGQYTGTLTITSPGATNTPQTVQVTLNVLTAPSIVAVPGNLSFLVPADGTAPGPQSITIISTGANTSFTTSAVSQGNWLSVSAGGSTPASVTVSVNPSGLLPGQTYNGAVSISAAASNPAVIQVPVTLTLAAQGPASLAVAPQSVYLSYPQGSGADLQHVAILNNGGGTVNFTAQGQTANCGNWLTVITTSGSATASSPAVLAFNVNPAGLTTQTCRGTLVLNDGNGNITNVPVYMAIGGGAQSVLLSQTAMNFIAASNGAAPAGQTFQILNPGSGSMQWNITSKVLSGANWLTVAPTSGTSQSLAQAGSPINVTVNPQGLDAGVYYGSVQVTSTGAFNSPQFITVAFTVLPPGSNPPPQVTPNGVIITATGGGSADTQTVTIFNSGSSSVSFSSAVITDDGQAWLVATPSSGTVSAGGSNSISLTANLNGVSGGLRHGTLRVAFSDGSVQTVDAQLAASGNTPGVPAVSACGSSNLAMEFLTPAPNFSASARVAIPLQVLVKDCNGGLLTSSTTGVDVLVGSSDLHLNYIGNGTWASTWTPPAATPAASLAARAVSISGGATASGAVTASGVVGPALPGAPAYVGAVVNAGSFLLPGLVAPGTMVSIFGSGLADGQSQVFTVPFPNTLQGAQFSLRGLPLPLFYASDGQVNAIIPTGFNANERDQLLVTRDTTLSAPADLLVADVDPGIFATNQQGTGQGAILVGGTAQIAAPAGSLQGAGPATAGQVVSIFMAGLGIVSNPPADGSPSTSANPSLTSAQPTVTIGGVQAIVGYSGLAPGEVGLYQINVTVPAGTPTGDAVPVVIAIGNGISNTVTMAIK